MNHTDQLIEQHIREYEARLKRIDELMARARSKGATPDAHAELAEVQDQRQALAGKLETLRQTPREQWEEDEIRQAGPMGVWDLVAQKLEHLLERLEK
ncbi:MAG TPA: hypothetical protein VK971_14020 [Thiohalobacter sp.]|nr:hypothetical protein [Thiohalobacter sp.]